MGLGERIEVAAEVAELLSADDLAMLGQSAATGYRCVTCDRPGQLAAQPATVVVLLTVEPGAGPDGPRVAHVKLAHARCAGSRVIVSVGSLPEVTEMRMTGTAAVVAHPSGPRALLIAESSWHLSLVTGGGDRVDPLLAGFLGQGLHLLASAQERPPDAPGWVASLPSHAEAVISDPSGGLFYAGGLDQPRPWRRLASRRGQVELLTGVVGAGADGSRDRAESLVTALADAARRGRLIGGTIAVR